MHNITIDQFISRLPPSSSVPEDSSTTAKPEVARTQPLARATTHLATLLATTTSELSDLMVSCCNFFIREPTAYQEIGFLNKRGGGLVVYLLFYYIFHRSEDVFFILPD